MIDFFTHTPAFAETLLLAGTILILLIDICLKGKKTLTFYLTQVLLIATFVVLVISPSAIPQVAYDGQLIFDPFARVLKAVVVLLVFLIFAYTKARDEFEHLRSEYLFLSLFSLMGALLLISAESLLTLYLGLELLSLPLYALLALARDRSTCGEAAIKYFVMGGLASGFLLFGFSLLYGLTGSLELPQLAAVLQNHSPAVFVAIVFVLAALAFKLGIVPFHMWIADVYEGAPLSVTPYLATVPKLAVLALFIRLFVETWAQTTPLTGELLMSLGIISLVVGNCAALVQKSLRRLVAYSTVANMGFVFMGLSLAGPAAYAGALFYAIVYAFTGAAFFGLLLCFKSTIKDIADLKGLHQHRPYLAFLFLLVLLSWVGLPPLLGFTAKLWVIMALIHQGYLWITILVLIMSVVAAAYYLKIAAAVYFEKSTEPCPQLHCGLGRVAVNVNVWALLVCGLLPQYSLALIYHVFV